MHDISIAPASSTLLGNVHSTNPTSALIPSSDHRRHHRHPHQTVEGMNQERGEKGPRDVVVVAWQPFWDVRWASSLSR